MRRHINLLIENLSKVELDELLEICKKGNYNFQFKCIKKRGIIPIETDYKLEDIGKVEFEKGVTSAPLFYFSIFSDTQGFDDLNAYMYERLILTNYSEFMNIADMDDEFEKEFKSIVELMMDNNNRNSLANRKFHNFIMPIKSIETLQALKKYSCHMTQFQENMIRDRIAVLSGERYKFEEEMVEYAKSRSSNIKALREKAKLNRKEFCEYFDIPYRTVEDWENGNSNCSSYLYKLMVEKLKNDGLI